MERPKIVALFTKGSARVFAPRLHMSPRTLHRRLEEEGTSFRQVLTEVRRELAARHLSERRLAIGEIAFLLGFSEPSAFHRAFKRWTGHGPLRACKVIKVSIEEFMAYVVGCREAG
jgi:AraC-like DNA-binding protein